MKLKKFLGHILTILGGVVLLIGIIAAILPNVQNRQMQLIVDSFRTPSDHWLIQSMNNGFTFAMGHVFLMILLGLVIIACGVLLLMSARTDARLTAQTSVHQVKTGTAVAATAAATAVAAGAVRTTTQQDNAANQAENPFARYLKDGDVPKSTAAPGSELADQPAGVVAEDDQRVNDNVLNLLDDFQQPPDSDALFIQPVHIINDESYRRPEDEELTDLVLTDEDADLAEELTFDESAIEVQAFEPEAEEPAPVVEATKPVAQLEKPRPLIRSTFRKAEQPQPAEEPAVVEAELPSQSVEAPVETMEEPAFPELFEDLPEITPEQEMEAEVPEIPAELQVESIPEAPVLEPVEIPAQAIETPVETPTDTPVEMVAETSVEAPAAQPVPRIKSTMGRKR